MHEVVVIGGGHAGIEAALAAARMGCTTLLLTMNLDSIGQMSCNPSIGGVGKGHLVREIDALGGEMGKAADETGIQFRLLNTKKGPAVQAPRAQADKRAYQVRMKRVVENQPNLVVQQGSSVGVVKSSSKQWEVITDLGKKHLGRTVVITTGTFLHGLMHIGQNKFIGGRMGDFGSTHLSGALLNLGVELARLKTGTPPRLSRASIEWGECECQPGDTPIPFFSFSTPSEFHVEQLPCYLTYTTKRTSDIIHRNLSESPLYSGGIVGVGPRYCPSIEDKIVRFFEKDRHQIYLEPEGFNTNEIYANGASTSMSFEVQIEIMRSIVGLQNAQLIRPAYAVEYDFAPPTQLHPWLELKKQEGLFLAGQINGTSGYEEAAAQGIIAGINAALRVQGKSPFVLKRSEAYIGVLIDDLVTQGAPEPYRMFTSRAEYRLLLRHDNADLRLSKYGYQLGLVARSVFDRSRNKQAKIEEVFAYLSSVRSEGINLAELVKRPESSIEDLVPASFETDTEALKQVEIALKYDGYISRQEAEVARLTKLETILIPDTIDYELVAGLRTEARQKLAKLRPYTIGHATRIAGVTPADIAVLNVWIRKQRSRRGQSVF